MALIRCGECGGTVSSSATHCPHCGYSSDSTCYNCVYYITDGEYDWCKIRKDSNGSYLDIDDSKPSCLAFKAKVYYD